jgi:hypothetical protein
VRTFVVGFGSGVDEQQLEDMAVAGQTGFAHFLAEDARPSPRHSTPSVAQCCRATTRPSTPATIQICSPCSTAKWFRATRRRWDYDPASDLLRFAGNACIALQSGIVTDLTIAYGCPFGEGEDEGEGEGEGEEDGEGEGCTDRCGNNCGEQACLIPPGECGACASDADCRPGSLCLPDGTCIIIGG